MTMEGLVTVWLCLLDSFGFFWILLDSFGFFWILLDSFGYVWAWFGVLPVKIWDPAQVPALVPDDDTSEGHHSTMGATEIVDIDLWRALLWRVSERKRLEKT